jgi:hypothetical protein
MSPASKPMWWVLAIGFAIGHFTAFGCVFFYCLDNYYDGACPLDWLGMTLVLPAYFIFPLLGKISFVLLPLNSFFWGCVLAEPVRWWLGWPSWRFSLRTMLIIMTLIALLLAMASAVQSPMNLIPPPVVGPN